MILADLYQRYGAKYGLDPLLLRAVAKTESSENPNAPVTSGQSVGLFQVSLATAQRLGFDGTVTALANPETNTDLAAHYIRSVIDSQDGPGGTLPLDLANFYSEYNSGKALLWQRSSEVYEHVQHFLANYASVVNFADAGSVLGLGLALAAFAYVMLKRKNK